MSTDTQGIRQGALPYLPEVLTQFIRERITKAVEGDPDVLLVRGSPDWDLQPHPSVHGRRVELRAAQSPLAVWELLAEHADLEGEEFLVIVTDVAEAVLGPEILGQVIKQRVFELKPWEAVKTAFGVGAIEARLLNEPWAAESLLDALSSSVKPPSAGLTLSRDSALAFLATRRLALDGFGPQTGRLDIGALLSWTQQPGALERFAALRTAERGPLADWLAETAGPAGRVLFALVETGRGADAAALGLVCAALWLDVPNGAQVAEPRLRTKLFFTTDPLAKPAFGGSVLRDEDFAAFGSAAADYVTALGVGLRDAPLDQARAERNRVLQRAEQLVTQTGAEEAAVASPLLNSGLSARYLAVAAALDTVVSGARRSKAASAGAPYTAPSSGSLGPLHQAIDDLRRHRFATEHTTDIERIQMALRLARWLAESETETATVADAVRVHVNDGGWADRALYRISSGTVHNVPALSAAFAKLGDAVRARRKARDERFAAMLATWTAAGSDPGRLLTVETFVPRVLEPLKKAEPGFLFILIDGMSAAVAADLGEELRRTRAWTEYDPAAGTAALGERRGVAAALPTLTRVSRTSLFAAELLDGTQDVERRRFPALVGGWGSGTGKIFHKGDLRADVGSGLSAAVQEAVNTPGTHVAVVLNNVDDLLDDSHDHARPWTVGDVDKLAELMNLAASAGRPVVIAADHGHMLDLGTEAAPADVSGSGRHRVDPAPAGVGEVELAGPRVVGPGNRIVALWDTDLRYGARKTGYHGGVSLAEFVIPVLALLPPGVTVPKSWAPVARTEPAWSDLRIADPSATTAGSDTAASERIPAKRAGHVSEHQESLLDLVDESRPVKLVDRLLASDLFTQRRAALPRPQSMPASKFGAALNALIDSGGVLPTVAVAAAAGELPVRARGFATNLRRVLNVDGESVLSELDQGATLRLDTDKLRVQFELGR